jgi:hypothetical protein
MTHGLGSKFASCCLALQFTHKVQLSGAYVSDEICKLQRGGEGIGNVIHRNKSSERMEQPAA